MALSYGYELVSLGSEDLAQHFQEVTVAKNEVLGNTI